MTQKPSDVSLFDGLSAPAQAPAAPAPATSAAAPQEHTAEAYFSDVDEALKEHEDLLGVVASVNALSDASQNHDVKQLAAIVGMLAGALALKASHLQDQIDQDAPEEMVQAVLELISILRDIKTASDKNAPGLKKLIADKLKEAEDIVSDVLGDEEEGEED